MSDRGSLNSSFVRRVGQQEKYDPEVTEGLYQSYAHAMESISFGLMDIETNVATIENGGTELKPIMPQALEFFKDFKLRMSKSGKITPSEAREK